MGEDNGPPPLDDLGERLRAAREHRGADSQQNETLSGGPPGMSGLGWAFRIGAEMVSALAMGVGIGLGLDWWLGTKPWFLVVFFLLGSAAAILNVYRAAMGYGLAVGYRKPEDGEDGQEQTARGKDASADGDTESKGNSGDIEGER
ncbi:MAG: AtpZ/AtpI family protein [Alphaproteobacteria bacterium]|nr:AtpZ/AtpI family protein [Alphaproteobacteria bacterium]